MFYCEECRKDKNWPGIFTTSYGNCEVCGSKKPCYDIPSRLLSVTVGNLVLGDSGLPITPPQHFPPKLPTIEEIKAYIYDPYTGEPLNAEWVEKQTPNFFQRYARNCGDRFQIWLRAHRQGKTVELPPEPSITFNEFMETLKEVLEEAEKVKDTQKEQSNSERVVSPQK